MYYYLIGALNVFLWSIKPLLERSCIKETNVLDCSLIRYYIGGIISIILALYLNRKTIFEFERFLYFKMIIVALIGYAGIIY